MSVNKIGIGTRVGKLTVIEATGERKSSYTVWKCRCDCGGEICLDTRCLQRGTVRDCGCESRVAPRTEGRDRQALRSSDGGAACGRGQKDGLRHLALSL